MENKHVVMGLIVASFAGLAVKVVQVAKKRKQQEAEEQVIDILEDDINE